MRKSLTRKERLAKKRDIDALFGNASRVEVRSVRLLSRPNGLEYNRILVTVRRGMKTAVARNRQKRMLREIYRNEKNSLKQGFDLAFILLREESSFGDLRATIERLVRQAGLASS
jgi:ribonuclease P protein component